METMGFGHGFASLQTSLHSQDYLRASRVLLEGDAYENPEEVIEELTQLTCQLNLAADDQNEAEAIEADDKEEEALDRKEEPSDWP